MSGDHMGIVAAWCNSGSSSVIHATHDRPAERTGMGIGRMGWFGKTLCGLKGLPMDGHPFMRPLNGTDGLTFGDFMSREPGQDFFNRNPCPKCRAAFNKRENR